MIGKKELARIHILKKDSGITGEDYRSLLSGAAGVDSAAGIETPDQYYKVITALSNLLAARGGLPLRSSGGEKPSFRGAVKTRAHKILGANYRVRLAGYLRKMGRADLDQCSDRELRRVMGFLSRPDRRKS
ncbi:MAG: regulatory protein GemA [Treponema sp.]|jgi:hypothetical protein|nr:regulatory protein GemA [Treponema sp.]